VDAFRRIHVLLNPASGPDDGHVERVLGVCRSSSAAAVHVLGADQDIEDVVGAALEDGADLIVAAGGDGTVRKVAARLVGGAVPLAVVPSGSANVFAGDLGIPLDPEAAMGLAEAEHPSLRSVDVARIEDTVFLVRFGVGWQAAMTVEAPGQMKRLFGRWAYALNAVRVRLGQTRVRYRIRSDGNERIEHGVCCIIANTAHLGLHGFTVSEDVNVSSGSLQVYVIRRASWRSMASILLRAATSTFMPEHGRRMRAHGDVIEWPAHDVELDARPTQIAALDGDTWTGGFPVHVRIRPGALRVVVS
jgi:diacylglycerol kinase family enzyme